MNLSKSLLPHHEYRDVLMDFREELFHRFVADNPVDCRRIDESTALTCSTPAIDFAGCTPSSTPIFLGVFWQIRQLYTTRPNIARYFFVLMLYLLLFAVIRIQTEVWVVYLIAPVIWS